MDTTAPLAPVAPVTQAAPVAQVAQVAGVAPLDEADLETLRTRRQEFKSRHTQALSSLMGQREDLRGVHALADLVDDAVRWTA